MSAAPRRAAVAYYVHVPFCAARCSYCDYPVTVGGLQRAPELVTAVLAEVDALRAVVADRPVAALYVGGGTPSFLPPGELRRLLTGLARALPTPVDGGGGSSRPTECTLEANPEDVTPELLDTCASAGVNRLSVGVQSFAGAPLRRLGRRHTAPELRASMELLARRWQGRLNLDLLVGVPGQRAADVRTDVDRAADLGVDHVTLLQLEDPPPGGLQPSADAADLWLAAGEHLRRRGYADYEVTHFARGGDRSAYLCHVQQLLPVAAAGPGAVGTLPAAATAPYGGAAASESGAVRCTHTASLDALSGRQRARLGMRRRSPERARPAGGAPPAGSPAHRGRRRRISLVSSGAGRAAWRAVGSVAAARTGAPAGRAPGADGARAPAARQVDGGCV